MKKLLSLTLVCLILVMTICCAFQSFSAATYLVSDGFVFSLNSQGNAVICEYVGGKNTVEVPETLLGYKVTAIEEYAFSGNADIVNISFEKAVNLESIGASAFADCTSIKSLTLTPSINSIGQSAFQNCTSLTSVKLKGAVTEISEQTFYGCTALENIVIPDSVNSIDYLAFGGCTALKTALISQSVTNIDNGFYGCKGLTVYGYEDSAAQNYAAKKNIPFVVIEDDDNFDVNLDGYIDVVDVTKMQKYLAGAIYFDKDDILLLRRCDVNRNGEFDINDSTVLQKKLAGLDLDEE